MRHTPLAESASTTTTGPGPGVSFGALALAALIAAAFPVAVLAASFPVVVGFLTVGLGGLAVAGASAST